MPNALLSWNLNGPANGKPTWWSAGEQEFRAARGPRLRAGRPFRLARQALRQERRSPRRRRHRLRPLRQRPDHAVRSVRLHRPGHGRTTFRDSYSFSTSGRYTGGAPALAPPTQRDLPLHAAQHRRHRRRIHGHLTESEAAVLVRAERQLRARDSRQDDTRGRLHGPALAAPADGRRCVHAAGIFQGSEIGHHLGAE